jgi:hypothetical protein
MTASELQEMARHVDYEIREFRHSLEKLNSIKDSDSEWNGTIELVLLHFRNVRAFMFCEVDKARYPDDLCAQDYIPGWVPTRDGVFDSTREDINKRLAHLTSARLVDAKWPLASMHKATDAVISEFEKQLRPDSANWFQRKAAPAITISIIQNYTTHTR